VWGYSNSCVLVSSEARVPGTGVPFGTLSGPRHSFQADRDILDYDRDYPATKEV
jgi:hypothetical protein